MPAAPTKRPDPPTAAELADVLGPAGELWTVLQDRIRSGYAPVTARWVYGGSRYGWSCRLERHKKGILYMTPDAGHFRVGLAMSDAAREAALASALPAEIREALAEAARAMEGWPVRTTVRTADDVAAVLALADIKHST